MSLKSVQDRIALAIKAKKREEELGVRKAAKECGVDPSTLSRLERGAYSTLPDGATLEKLADWLDTSVGELLGGEGKTQKGKTQYQKLSKSICVRIRIYRRKRQKLWRTCSKFYMTKPLKTKNDVTVWRCSIISIGLKAKRMDSGKCPAFPPLAVLSPLNLQRRCQLR